MKKVYWHHKVRFWYMLEYVASLVPFTGEVGHKTGKNMALEKFREMANRYINFYEKGQYEDSYVNRARELEKFFGRASRELRSTESTKNLLHTMDLVMGEIVAEAYFEQNGGLLPYSGERYES